MDFGDIESVASIDLSKEINLANEMYTKGDYKGVIIFIDSLYGWGEGELGREYTQEEAARCMKVLGVSK